MKTLNRQKNLRRRCGPRLNLFPGTSPTRAQIQIHSAATLDADEETIAAKTSPPGESRELRV